MKIREDNIRQVFIFWGVLHTTDKSNRLYLQDRKLQVVAASIRFDPWIMISSSRAFQIYQRKSYLMLGSEDIVMVVSAFNLRS